MHKDQEYHRPLKKKVAMNFTEFVVSIHFGRLDLFKK